MPFYLAGIYGKGPAFPEILVPNSLSLHTIVLKNSLLFSGSFRKGNLSHITRCEQAYLLQIVAEMALALITFKNLPQYLFLLEVAAMTVAAMAAVFAPGISNQSRVQSVPT